MIPLKPTRRRKRTGIQETEKGRETLLAHGCNAMLHRAGVRQRRVLVEAENISKKGAEKLFFFNDFLGQISPRLREFQITVPFLPDKSLFLKGQNSSHCRGNPNTEFRSEIFHAHDLAFSLKLVYCLQVIFTSGGYGCHVHRPTFVSAFYLSLSMPHATSFVNTNYFSCLLFIVIFIINKK
jgi:hypothetical protein